MMTCLVHGQPATLPHGINGNTGVKKPDNSNTGETLRSSAVMTLERTKDCGTPLQLLLYQNRMLQVNLARSFWRGIGDIKEALVALVPNHINNLNMNTSVFYICKKTIIFLRT